MLGLINRNWPILGIWWIKGLNEHYIRWYYEWLLRDESCHWIIGLILVNWLK